MTGLPMVRKVKAGVTNKTNKTQVKSSAPLWLGQETQQNYQAEAISVTRK